MKRNRTIWYYIYKIACKMKWAKLAWVIRFKPLVDGISQDDIISSQ